jgi:hypothetical protein
MHSTMENTTPKRQSKPKHLDGKSLPVADTDRQPHFLDEHSTSITTKQRAIRRLLNAALLVLFSATTGAFLVSTYFSTT